MTAPQPQIDTSPAIGDEVKETTCYMCACRCGIRVHLKDGAIRYIEGNKNHPVNKGVLCAKGAAGIMQHYSPARLSKPLRRVGERGSGDFKEIEWEEALDTATAWLARIRATDPRGLAFFTGRDQSQALTSWWAKAYGTPNYAAHGGFCSVNMAAAGLYTMGSAFWEFSEPDWERAEYFLMFGVAEDHASNPIKRGLSKLKARGAKFVSVNPVRTGYSAVADEWLGITPGTDGLFVMSLMHELLRGGKVDLDFLIRYTNASWLVIEDDGGQEDGLIYYGEKGRPVCWDLDTKTIQNAYECDGRPALKGTYTLPDGRKGRPVFELLFERYLEDQYHPDAVADITGVDSNTIRRIAAELAEAAFDKSFELNIPWTDAYGHRHEKTIGRPVAMHAMRGISAHSNGFHTCRAIHLLQILLGSIDVPGGLRYKPPYPKSLNSLPRPSGRPEDVLRNAALAGPHLGFPTWPQHLLVDDDGNPTRIDKAFSWEAPLAAHGMMHTVIANAWKGDPYPIDTLFMYMANMAWNSAMNTSDTIAMLTDKDARTGEYKIPHIIYSDAFASEMTAYADLILPDTTYLERWDCISLLDRPISEPDGPADAIRQPVLAPDRDVRAFQDVLLDLGARLGLDGMIREGGGATYPGGYADYLSHHQRLPGIGMLAGWRGEDGTQSIRGASNKDQLQRYVENDCFWHETLPQEMQYYRHSNQAYLDYAQDTGFVTDTNPIVMNLYAEELQRFRLAARGFGERQVPKAHRARIETYFDPLPFWYPTEDITQRAGPEYPLHALTQRPAHMYHSWGGQNAWLRQIQGDNKLYVSRSVAAQHEIADEDWIWVESRHGRIKVRAKVMDGVNEHTVWTWNAIGKRSGAWNLDPNASESQKGFLLNHLIDDLLPEQAGQYRYSNSDPVTGQAAWFDLRVRIEKVGPNEAGVIEPRFSPLKPPPGVAPRPATSQFGKKRGGIG